MSDHPVINTLEANRPTDGGRRLSFGGSSVLDQVLRDANANANANINGSSNHSENNNNNKDSTESPSSPSTATTTLAPPPTTTNINAEPVSPRLALSTTATLPNATWQPLQSKSSNHVHPTQRAAAAEQLAKDLATQHEHDKPSVLPKIVPGFKERLADVHHASLKSIANVPTSTAAGAETSGHQQQQQQQQQGVWTGGTMFPVIPPGFKDPSPNQHPNHQLHQNDQVSSPQSHAHRLSKSSILYETADVPVPGEDTHMAAVPSPLPHPQQQQPQSRTLVQGGSGDRRWSHELSPEKAGLVGSVIEAAGLIKDVVLDKITHHGPGSTIESSEDSDILFGESSPSSTCRPSQQSTNNRHHTHELTEQDKQTAARAAFGGGSDETGDQTVYYSGLKTATTAPSSTTQSGSNTDTTTTTTTPGYGVQDLLASAPQAAQVHHRSLLHEAVSNPEVYKSTLLNHPEKLGYHSRDPDWVGPVVSEDPVLARLGVGNTGSGGGVIANTDDRREQQK